MQHDANRNALYARAIAEELARSGVRLVVVAPGSRSAPLALACAAEERLTLLVHLDERAAAFCALGAGRATGRAAAVITSSGTAVANLLPAAVEANQGGVPLLLISADRPPRLRRSGAPQTVDQVHLLERAARTFIELPLPCDDASTLRAVRSRVCDAVLATRHPAPAPVHLNVPLDDPLDPRPASIAPSLLEDRLAREGRPDGSAFTTTLAARPALDLLSPPNTALSRVHSARSGVIVCGPHAPERDLVQAISDLAGATGFPVFAGTASNLRDERCANRTTAYDGFLTSPIVREALLPEVVIRFGAPPVSKVLSAWLVQAAAAGAETIIVARERPLDPDHIGGLHLALPTVVAAGALTRAASPSPPIREARAAYRGNVARAEQAAHAAIGAASGYDAYEAEIARALTAALPPHGFVFAGNSLPIRQLDAFAAQWPRDTLALANRGANGIDGLISSAIGASLASGRPGVVWLGDLSFLHDVGGLLALVRRPVPLTIVCTNNDGGGIFHRLPIAQSSDRFEELFATPHGLDMEGAARLYRLAYRRCAPAQFAENLADAIAGGVPNLIEVPIDREASARWHTRAFQAAGLAAQTELSHSEAPRVSEDIQEAASALGAAP